MQLSTYLFFDGQCEAAFKFYEGCLGGKIEAIMSHAGTPAEEHVPAEWRDKVMHACMTVGGVTLMGSDAPPGHFQVPQGFAVQLSVDTPEEAERVFAALSENGTVQMPLEETFWTPRFGMLVDQFGTPWMLNCASTD